MAGSNRIAVFILATLLAVFAVSGQIVSGSATIVLAGPASREVVGEAQSKALQKLKVELIKWLNEEEEISIDTTNTLQVLCFGMFLDSCRSAAKTESTFKGKQLTLTYLLTGDIIRQKITAFNAAVDALALQKWSAVQEALERKDFNTAYTNGISALYHSMAHLGPPIATPEAGGRDLSDDIRRIVQQLFDKMEVKSSGMILSGKTGLSIQNPPTISLVVDSQPLPGLTFTGRLQNGTILFSAITDENGRIIVDKFNIPFVPNGTLLEIGPNPASALGVKSFIDPADLGIKQTRNQVQSFIFKVSRPVYVLDYKATSVSTITLPPEFANVTHVKKYLEDSCYLQEKTSASGPTDLDITVKAQVSSYTYDETEEIGIKVTAQVMVKGLLQQPAKTNTNELVFEKRYGRYLTPPYGLYFWEANSKLRETIKATIAGLD